MAASSKATPTSRRRRKNVNSSHVAPRGQRHTVAQPKPHFDPAPPPAPSRRRANRSRKKHETPPPLMIQPRGDALAAILSGRMLSAVIAFSLLVVLFLFFQADAFYISHIEVGGLSYMTAEEVFALSGVANMHLFWLDADEIEAAIRRSPTVADVHVSINWPPHGVQIEIQEREPALVWEQGGYRTWIDVRGRVMPQRSDLGGLLRIVAEGDDEAIGPDRIIPQDVVDGALQLRALYSNIDVLVYNPIRGLGYQDGRGWRVWYGSGRDMTTKLLVYNTIVDDLVTRGIQPEYIDVSNPDAPFYKVWWGRDVPGDDAPPDEHLTEDIASTQ